MALSDFYNNLADLGAFHQIEVEKNFFIPMLCVGTIVHK
jgi:hypothetical protein